MDNESCNEVGIEVGVIHAIIIPLAVPPNESFNKDVNLESRYGIYGLVPLNLIKKI